MSLRGTRRRQEEAGEEEKETICWVCETYFYFYFTCWYSNCLLRLLVTSISNNDFSCHGKHCYISVDCVHVVSVDHTNTQSTQCNTQRVAGRTHPRKYIHTGREIFWAHRGGGKKSISLVTHFNCMMWSLEVLQFTRQMWVAASSSSSLCLLMLPSSVLKWIYRKKITWVNCTLCRTSWTR